MEEFALGVPDGLIEWLRSDGAVDTIRREAGDCIRIVLPNDLLVDERGAISARERYGLSADEIVVRMDGNGTVGEVIAGIGRAWASAGENPLERAREFLRGLPVSVLLA